MPVEIDQVEVPAGDESRATAPAAAAFGPRAGAPDPGLALAIARATALQCSRALRLRAD